MDSPIRLIGYARVSTTGQDLEYQLAKLREAGCTTIFHEKKSGKSRSGRPELQAMLGSLGKGDVVLATATDRIARDPVDLLNIMAEVKTAEATLRLLDEPFIDTSSEMSDLIMFVVGWAARWHRKRILENTAHGRELAKKKGVRFGRKPKLTPLQRTDIARLWNSGESSNDLAHKFDVSISTITRVLAQPVQ